MTPPATTPEHEMPSPVTTPAWTPDEGAARVRDLFVTAFGTEPAVVRSAPGRVNLIGEHTDYNGGLALPIALPHRTYAAVRPREDDLVRLVSAQEPGVVEVRLGDAVPGAVHGWAAYVVGVAWAQREAGSDVGGVDVAIDSCVPSRARQSSTAALEATQEAAE